MAHVLVVDDEIETLGWLAEVARAEGFTVSTADSIRSARIEIGRHMPDIVFSDLQLPDGEGISLIDDLRPRDSAAFVLITGHASVDSAIAALRAGVSDYLVKPVDVDRVRAMLKRVPRSHELRSEIGELRDELRRLGRFGHMLGSSPKMQVLYDQIARVSPTSANVFLIGESGTGKELAAQTIHELSRRKRQPFLPLNCGAVSPQLIESELFGHERGSFTGADRQHKGFFERANGGTIFLDEVTEMPLELQVKLLRVLETGAFTRVGNVQPIATDVRIISATNRIPEHAVAEGKLREDLYHRLNVFPVRLPPLRERGDDIALLARFFLEQMNRAEGTVKRFAIDTLARWQGAPWPGNVRELKNAVQRAYILADEVVHADGSPDTPAEPLNVTGTSAVAVAADACARPRGSAGGEAGDDGESISIRVGTPLEEVERRVTLATLEQCGWVKRRAAEVLGISLKTLYNRLETYGDRPPAGIEAVRGGETCEFGSEGEGAEEPARDSSRVA